MRLRNKKTGEVADFKIIADYDDCTSGWRLEKQDGSVLFYDFIDEIKEEWEDYTPKEPLIKDEKTRKAIRAWAEANEREYLLVIKSGGRLEISDGSPHLIYISFHVDNDTLKNLGDRTYYPIDELCGEEEE